MDDYFFAVMVSYVIVVNNSVLRNCIVDTANYITIKLLSKQPLYDYHSLLHLKVRKAQYFYL